MPSYYSGKFPLSTYLAARVRALLADDTARKRLPAPVRDWLSMQQRRSVLPGPEGLLMEGFPRGGKHYLVCYPFEGRLAHQTLGMLLTRRMERAGYRPFGFVASEYALAVWSLNQVDDVDPLFGEDILGDDLEAGGIQSYETDFSQRCPDRRVDRPPPSRSGEDGQADDLFLRPDL